MPADDSQPITLIDETGLERRFRLHDAFDVEGVPYYLVEAQDDPSVVLLLREGTGGLETVDGEEFKRVIAALEGDEVE
jgi:diaminopimelate decarboxylase